MILIKCTLDNRPADLLVVAQNPTTYELLGFSSAGTAYNYDTDHSEFDGYGRYKPRNGELPATELELRTEFFTLRAEREASNKKVAREAAKVSPITVTLRGADYTFDLDSAAIQNINNTVESFAAVRQEAVAQGWPDDGTIPWVLSDNSLLPVTATDLQMVKDAGAARGLRLHMQYNAEKAELYSLVP